MYISNINVLSEHKVTKFLDKHNIAYEIWSGAYNEDNTLFIADDTQLSMEVNKALKTTIIWHYNKLLVNDEFISIDNNSYYQVVI